MQVGCYSLDLYCDCEHKEPSRLFPHVYTAETGARCRRQAKNDGWKLLRKNLAICPECAKDGKRPRGGEQA